MVVGFLAASAAHANTTNNYTGSVTGSVLTGTNWSLLHAPTVSEDAVFTATTGIRTQNNGNLTVGSFNVTASTGTFTIRNQTASTTSTLTLGGPGNLGNSVAGTASTDLLSAAAGSTFNITGPGSPTSALLVLRLDKAARSILPAPRLFPLSFPVAVSASPRPAEGT